jgi:hypothetical protein
MKSYFDPDFLLETGTAKQIHPEHAERMTIYEYIPLPPERVIPLGEGKFL